MKYDLPEDVKRSIRKMSDEIHANPELGFQEFTAARLQTELLEQWGAQVTRGIAGLDTAYRAEWRLGTGDGPAFAIFSEYDALKKIGHACGHNLICASALAGAYMAVDALEKAGVNGRFVLFGSPGEEQLGGKVVMQEHGAFEGIDAAIISHPYDVTSTDDGAYSVTRFLVQFHGKASHAGMAPEQGINALDALILFFNGIGLWRQQMAESARVHGIIRKGGDAPNVIPDETEAFFYLRAPDKNTAVELERRFREIVAGAATQTGCTCDCIRTTAYDPCKINAPLNNAYADYLESIGHKVIRAKGNEGRASTDFGNVSQIMPGANLHFGICHEEHGTALHTVDFEKAAGMDHGFDEAMICGGAMAHITLRYFTDDAFRNEVHQAFDEQK